MSGLKWLFLALWDEFKTFTLLRALFDQDVESEANHYHAQEIAENISDLGSRGSKSVITSYKKSRTYQKWYQTKEGRDLCMKRLGHVLAIAAVIIYFIQMQANRRQAEAAEKQLGEMKREQMLSERAWVFAFEGIVQPHVETNKGDFFRINFRNTGKTPALHVRAWMDQSGDLGISSTNQIDSASPQFSGILAPDATGSVDTAVRPMEPNTIEYLRHVNIGYFVYGIIRYDDIFGTNHWSRFVYRVRLAPDVQFTDVGIGNSCDNPQANQGNE